MGNHSRTFPHVAGMWLLYWHMNRKLTKWNDKMLKLFSVSSAQPHMIPGKGYLPSSRNRGATPLGAQKGANSSSSNYMDFFKAHIPLHSSFCCVPAWFKTKAQSAGLFARSKAIYITIRFCTSGKTRIAILIMPLHQTFHQLGHAVIKFSESKICLN